MGHEMKKCRIALVIVLLGWLACNACFAQTTANYDGLVRQGNTQLQSGNNDAALTSANAAIRANADRWEAYAVAGGALMNLKRYEEATDQFGHAIDHAPEAKQAGLRDLRRKCLVLEAGSPSTAVPQLPVPTPPQPADNGPSLADTMKFIQEKLSLLEEVKYTLYGHIIEPATNEVIPIVDEIGNVAVRPESCTIGYHLKVLAYDSTAKESDMRIPLRDVQMTALSTMEEYSKNSYGKDGNNVWVDRTDPPVFVLQVLRNNGPANTFEFTDKDLANRVDKAIFHAVLLCKAGNKEPF
jgi:tetratricopeptide (TPR) repeat protein